MTGHDSAPMLPIVLRLRPAILALLLLPASVAVLLALTADSNVWLIAAILTGNVVLRLRQKTVLDNEGIEVTYLTKKRIPWREVAGFKATRGAGGGVTILTAAGPVRSAVPCSWWGGPPRPGQVEMLERIRLGRAAG